VEVPVMSLDERTSRPLYRQVADELRVQIEQRHLAPGRQLPTEAKLMDRYGVSRNTIRLALGVLRTEGLVVTGQGRGSFVADVAVRRRPRGPGGLHRHVAHGAGDPLDSELSEPTDGARIEVSVSTRPAPPFIADRLGLRAGDRVVTRHRLRFRDAVPDMSSDSFLPADLVADSPLGAPGPLGTGVVGLLADLGHPIRRVADEIGVRMPSPAEAQELQIATGVPVLAVQRTAFDGGERPVLTISALLPGDRHVLRYDAALSTDDERSDPVA
jgi:GntR family transcriptional regulator